MKPQRAMSEEFATSPNQPPASPPLLPPPFTAVQRLHYILCYHTHTDTQTLAYSGNTYA